MPEDKIREIEPVAKRMLERTLISSEYARSHIIEGIKPRIGMTEVRDYYTAHQKEFMTTDKIVWQDIFIPTNRSYPTVPELKRFAEDQIARCRTSDDFNRLMVYNEGSTKGSGEGVGHKMGEIQPRELEGPLFQLRAGEIGPVIPWVDGVHLIRVLKRDYAGQMPLDTETQKAIRKKLEGQLAEVEYRRMVRELRSRAVIVVEAR